MIYFKILKKILNYVCTFGLNDIYLFKEQTLKYFSCAFKLYISQNISIFLKTCSSYQMQIKNLNSQYKAKKKHLPLSKTVLT